MAKANNNHFVLTFGVLKKVTIRKIVFRQKFDQKL